MIPQVLAHVDIWSLLAKAYSGASLGTGQDLTFGIPIGVFVATVLFVLLVFRSGHERAHRLQVLRRQRNEELSFQRNAQLEAIHRHPSMEEGLPR